MLSFAVMRCSIRLAFAVFAIITLATIPASASTIWNWDFSGSGITASGTFTTVARPNSNGGYLITAITGTRNGDRITGLQTAGTSIPGNEPYVVDNLVFVGPGPQLTSPGFGFSTSGGNFSNAFYAAFLPKPGYLEFFSTPPFTAGAGFGHSELPVQFSATPISTPEPASFALMISTLTLAIVRSRFKL